MNTSRRSRLRDNLGATDRSSPVRPFSGRPLECLPLMAVVSAIAVSCLAGCGRWEAQTSGAQIAEGAIAPVASSEGESDAARCSPESDPFAPATVQARKAESGTLTTANTKSYPSEEYQASIVQILAHRDRYHGKEVQITGYLRVQSEETAIYLSKEDADYGMTRNGFCVTLSKSATKYDQKYVLIEGTFDKDLMGHMSAWQGAIKNVTRVVELTKRD